MKTETYPEEANLTTGQILRQAREKNELSQQTVADRLCLKLSTVRDIEEDNIPSNISPTFLRGYIRAYAKLVQVPESDILSILDKQMPSKATIKTSPMQSFSAGKKRKKRDGWLMKITWAIILLLLGMTVLWWWQNYKAQQVTLSDQSSVENTLTATSEKDAVAPVPAIAGDNVKDNQPVAAAQQGSLPQSSTAQAGSPAEANSPAVNSQTPIASAVQAEPVNPSLTTPPASPATKTASKTEKSANAGAGNAVVSSSSVDVNNTDAVSHNELVVNFNGECWIAIKNAAGKALFSGIKYKGDRLKFSGHSLYALTIGAPAEVNIQFQGKPVDLSAFMKKKGAARLKLQ